jgi:hypothetical protein
MIHHPDLAASAYRNGYRFQADRHGPPMSQTVFPDAKDLQPIVGSIDGIEAFAVW